jgi:type II secretory pathway pseudopilin PulG
MKLMLKGERRLKNLPKNQAGYTMLELVVVVIILIILVVLVVVH